MRSVLVAVVLALMLVAASCSDGGGEAAPSASVDDSAAVECETGDPVQLVPEVVRTLDHPADSYSQGLVIDGEALYESGGRYGESTLRELDPETGEELRRAELDPEVFAEGLTIGAGGNLVQLTWREGVAYVWDPATFEVVDEFAYEGEGWGLTTLDDGTLVMSDGSDTLVTRDPEDFSVIDEIQVQRTDGDAGQLNELEWDGESVWASRYTTNEVVQIDLECGSVTAVVDVGELRADAEATAKAEGDPIDVPNGIAHVPGTDRYLVTGKWWPSMYEVRLVPA